MRKAAYLIISLACTIGLSCSSADKRNKEASSELQGTWKLISGTIIEGNDTTITDYTRHQEMIKIINDTHFAFLRHDLNKGKDSATAVFVAGGGHYTVKGNIYTEFLEYCNFRDWENNQFAFEFSINGDTLTTKGVEKVEEANVNHINIEKLVRVK